MIKNVSKKYHILPNRFVKISVITLPFRVITVVKKYIFLDKNLTTYSLILAYNFHFYY